MKKYTLLTIIIILIVLAVLFFVNNKSENTRGISQSTKDSIAKLISEKFNRPADSLTIEVLVDTGVFAKGTYNELGAGGGVWFATKTENEWELVATGNGIVSCDDVNNHDFPREIIPSCLDNGTIIDLSWSRIKRSIENCNVKSVFQNHNREVSITLKNGGNLSAVEPKIDDVFDSVTAVLSKCGNVIMSTE